MTRYQQNCTISVDTATAKRRCSFCKILAVGLTMGLLWEEIWRKCIHNGLGKTILQGTVKGGRRQDRQKKRWGNNVREWTGLELAKPQRAAENGGKWRKLVVKSSVVPLKPLRLRVRCRWTNRSVSATFNHLNCVWFTLRWRCTQLRKTSFSWKELASVPSQA